MYTEKGRTAGTRALKRGLAGQGCSLAALWKNYDAYCHLCGGHGDSEQFVLYMRLYKTS